MLGTLGCEEKSAFITVRQTVALELVVQSQTAMSQTQDQQTDRAARTNRKSEGRDSNPHQTEMLEKTRTRAEMVFKP